LRRGVRLVRPGGPLFLFSPDRPEQRDRCPGATGIPRDLGAVPEWFLLILHAHMTVQSRPGAGDTRAGYVALIGPPNAGKSTLLNQMIGEHLSIVTPKAQTTWQRVTGILTTEATQLIFLDTPGILEAKDLLQRSMTVAALSALEDADVVVVIVDARYRPSARDRRRLEEVLDGRDGPLHLALNKSEVADPGARASWRAWGKAALPGARVHEISARTGMGVEVLLGALCSDVPASPFFYPDDEIASQPVRFFVEELVRETVFERFDQEIPYSVLCRVGEFREAEDPVYIQIDLHVERRSQKGIVIGQGGQAIRSLGEAARRKIEHFLGRRVYLDLWVKPLKSWRRDRATLGRLGFQLPEADE